ncbi:Predicted nuclease (RNAse H fold) [Streptomyces sp. WMMB 322]|nr:Predicted nuclease (RNAse H fold) [Streptomyces sp. WMMB 322]
MGPRRDTDRMVILGVDACKQGWVAVELSDGAYTDAQFSNDLRDILDATLRAEVVAVDMPLGLVSHGWRKADTEAKAVLGPRANSVFRVPPQQVWLENHYEAANRRCQELTGSGLSQQTWGLAAKLRAANECLESDGGRLYEVHPEVSFWALNGKAPLPHKKTSWEGQMTRRALLRKAGVVLPDDLGLAGRVPPDDVLDAAAAAWSAHRIAKQDAFCLPDPPQLDRRGRPIAIWY